MTSLLGYAQAIVKARLLDLDRRREKQVQSRIRNRLHEVEALTIGWRSRSGAANRSEARSELKTFYVFNLERFGRKALALLSSASLGGLSRS